MGLASQQRAMWGVPVPRPISREEKKLWTKQEKAMYKAFELQGKPQALTMMRAYFANKKALAEEQHDPKARLSFKILLPKKFCEESAQLTTLLKENIAAFCSTEVQHVEATGAADFKSDSQVCVEFSVELEHPGDKVHEKLKERGVLAAHLETNGIPAEMQEDSVLFSPAEEVAEGKESEPTDDQADENPSASGEDGEGRKRKAAELSV